MICEHCGSTTFVDVRVDDDGARGTCAHCGTPYRDDHRPDTGHQHIGRITALGPATFGHGNRVTG